MIRCSLRGTIIDVDSEAIRKSKSTSMLQDMLQHATEERREEVLYIDEHPEFFHLILDYHRYNAIFYDSRFSQEMWKLKCDRWLIETLEELKIYSQQDFINYFLQKYPTKTRDHKSLDRSYETFKKYGVALFQPIFYNGYYAISIGIAEEEDPLLYLCDFYNCEKEKFTDYQSGWPLLHSKEWLFKKGGFTTETKLDIKEKLKHWLDIQGIQHNPDLERAFFAQFGV